MTEKLTIEMSRYCVPFTPFRGRLEDTSIALVSTAGVHHKDDLPFNVDGDTSFRTVPGGAPSTDLRIADAHYDHACVDQDLNCVFPVDRLAELAADKRIGGVAAKHFSMGFSQALRQLRDETIPLLVREIDQLRPGAVLLTGGWRLCHRTVVTVQRGIEMIGIPTVLITVEPGESAQARPPRALCPRGFTVGHSLGRARDVQLQQAIIMDALSLLTAPPSPGEVVVREYA